MSATKSPLMAALLSVLACGCSSAPPAPRKYAMSTEIPASITTPDAVPTRLGALSFKDGVPSEETVAKLQDNLLFMRGVEAFLDGLRGASVAAALDGLRSVGVGGGTIGITESLMDGRSLFLTPNADTVYAITCLDLTRG